MKPAARIRNRRKLRARQRPLAKTAAINIVIKGNEAEIDKESFIKLIHDAVLNGGQLSSLAHQVQISERDL